MATGTEAKKGPRVRYFEIDLLRFVAAAVVVLFHYTFRGYAADGYSPVSYPAAGSVFKYGYLGVELFFMISGFVILHSAWQATPRQFIISRLTRLYPAFWVACTATFLGLLLVGSANLPRPTWGQYLANLTMLQHFLRVPSLDGIYWTLTYELKFYLVVLLLSTLRLLPRIEAVVALWLGYALLFQLGVGLKPLTALLVPDFAAYFLGGMVLCLIARSGLRWRLAGLLAACYGLSVVAALREAVAEAAHYHSAYSPWVVGGLVTAMYLALLLVALRRTAELPLRWAPAVGALTYPLYLLHHNLGFLVLQRLGPFVDKYLLLASLCALMLAAAYTVHRGVERPLAPHLARWLERVLPGRGGPPGGERGRAVTFALRLPQRRRHRNESLTR